jgi:hypothetical protein
MSGSARHPVPALRLPTDTRMSPLRLHTLRLGAALLLGSGVACAADRAHPGIPEGPFRVARGIAAPWLTAEQPAPDVAAWRGRTLEFGADRFVAPGQLGCAPAQYATDQRPAEGLFQGNLPAPAADAAARLGLVALPVPSVDLTCDSGVFDFHWATPDALMLALDNVIWVLDRSPGARAGAGTPEAEVQRLLEAHFADDMGFLPDLVGDLRPHFSAALGKAIDLYFGYPFPQDEVPPIDGDPITDSQEYPVLFSVREATLDERAARVPVRYDDGYRARTVEFVLRREGDAWRVDDIRYEHGGSFRELLMRRP